MLLLSSTVSSSKQELQKLSRLAARRGDYVRLHGREPSSGPCRLGLPHRLCYQKSDSRTVISSRARWAAHSGILEGHALLLTVKRLCCSRAKHHKKVVVQGGRESCLGCRGEGANLGTRVPWCHQVNRCTCAVLRPPSQADLHSVRKQSGR